MKKPIKDYWLLLHIAKIASRRTVKNKDTLVCTFPYGDEGTIDMTIGFEKRRSKVVLFDLTDVFACYGTRKFQSNDAMIDAIVAKYNFWTKFEDDDGSPAMLGSDLKVNRVKHGVSAVLSNLTLLISVLNEFLGVDSPNLSEDEWRALHRDLLKKQKRNSALASAGCLAAFVLGVYTLFALQGEGFLSFLSFFMSAILILGGVLGFIYFLFRYKLKKSELKKSLAARK